MSAEWIRAERKTQRYKQARDALLSTGPVCVHCRRHWATVADHQPPLALFHSFEEWLSGGGRLVPSCKGCSDSQGAAVQRRTRPPIPVPSRSW